MGSGARSPALIRRIGRRHREAGGRRPFAAPGAYQGTPFEGYFWRFTDVANGRVVIALCGLTNRPSPPGGLVAFAVHPEGAVEAAATGPGHGAREDFGLEVPGALRGDASRLHLRTGGGASVTMEVRDGVRYPRRALGATGLAAPLPGMPHYWQPVVLDGEADGEVELGGRRIEIAGARAYAERTWGSGFPRRWWWGQAHGLGDDVTVAFAGGPVRLGPVAAAPTSVVLRLGGRVLTFVPPFAASTARVRPGSWEIAMRSPRYSLTLEGSDPDGSALALPVPLGAGRSAPRSSQALAGRMRVTLARGARTVFAGETRLAGLEQPAE